MDSPRHRLSPRFAFTLLGLAGWAEGPLWSQGVQSFQGLGDLPGGDFSSLAWDLSADGSVVIGYSVRGEEVIDGRSQPILEAFRWTQAEGMRGLGFLAGGSYQFSEAIALSADGSVAAGHSSSGASVSSEAFRWTQSEGMVGLGFLVGSSTQSWAYGLSPDGSVVVGFAFGLAGVQAFRWTDREGMVTLGSLGGGNLFSRAWDASQHGEVIVGMSSLSEGREAFRWTREGGMTGLGSLSSEEVDSAAYAVSAGGTTVVGYSESDLGYEAFRWTSGGGMVGLGDLPGGKFKSEARGVSADGAVIAGTGTTDQGEEAFIWDLAHGMRSLRGVMERELGLDLSGWRLERAYRVSDDGRVVVGQGINPAGQKEAWRAVLPPKALPAEPLFRRGDCSGDGASGDLTDAVFLLTYNFLGGTRPPCLAACDADGDGMVAGAISDAIYLLSYGFLAGLPPVDPFPACGPGTRAGDPALGCESLPPECQ